VRDHFRMLAAYNGWANARVFDAASKLDAAAYRYDGGAAFRSVHGTLNHLLVADRIWMARLTGTTPAVTALDAIVHHDFADLRAAREAEDARIVDFVDSLDDAAIRGTVRYWTIVNPREIVQPLAPALSHVFNHQTHHRGQVHALLTRLAGGAPSLDLIAFQRETGTGLAAG